MALQSWTATFNGTQDTVAVAWTAMPGGYLVFGGQPVITDSFGAVMSWLTGVSASGATVNVSERFSGTVSGAVMDTP